MNDFENDKQEYDPNAFEIEAFRDVVRSHWVYHGICNLMNWSVFKNSDGVWQIEIAPPFQIVYAGPDDGKTVWTPFEFDIAGFLKDPDVDFHECGVMTRSEVNNTQPFLGIIGTYQGKEFAMRIHLEPDPETLPLEVIDRIKNEVRNIPEGEQS